MKKQILFLTLVAMLLPLFTFAQDDQLSERFDTTYQKYQRMLWPNEGNYRSSDDFPQAIRMIETRTSCMQAVQNEYDYIFMKMNTAQSELQSWDYVTGKDYENERNLKAMFGKPDTISDEVYLKKIRTLASRFDSMDVNSPYFKNAQSFFKDQIKSIEVRYDSVYEEEYKILTLRKVITKYSLLEIFWLDYLTYFYEDGGQAVIRVNKKQNDCVMKRLLGENFEPFRTFTVRNFKDNYEDYFMTAEEKSELAKKEIGTP